MWKKINWVTIALSEIFHSHMASQATIFLSKVNRYPKCVVLVNGEKIFSELNLSADYEPLRAVNRKIRIEAKNGQGISIDFESIESQPILNGLEVKRIF